MSCRPVFLAAAARRVAAWSLVLSLAAGAVCASDGTAVGAAAEPPGFVVAGYLPGYRLEAIDPQRLGPLTHVILFSVEPRADGSIDASRLPVEQTGRLQRDLQARGVRVSITIGGWGRSNTFGEITADAALRSTLANSLAGLCSEREIDGVDVDWEHPRTDAERAQLGEFLTELRQALEPAGRQVTIAVAPWERLAPETIAAVHRVHLMAYDNGGRHSTPEYARESVARMLEQGVPRDKLCLGIPFYGRPFEGKFGAGRTYADIVSRHQPPLDADEAAGLYFNGPHTVAAKVALAQRERLAGVMIWEIGQDAPDPERSLLESIRRALAPPSRGTAQ
jgi:GH18 family chitinase